jgi:hypothetical protein
VIQATICESAPNKVLDEASFNLPDNKWLELTNEGELLIFLLDS